MTNQQPQYLMPATVPNFSNQPHEKASAHWLAFEDYCDELKVQAADQVKKFRLTLSGEPRVWFKENQRSFSTEDNAENVNILERLFKSTYGKAMSRSDYLKQIVSIAIKPDEDLGAYRNRVQSTAAKARITDQEQIMIHFIEGLPAHVRIALKAKRDANLEECMLTARALMSETKAPTSQLFSAQHSSVDQHRDIVDQMQSLLLSFNHSKSSDHSSDHRQSRRPFKHSPHSQSSHYSHSRNNQNYHPQSSRPSQFSRQRSHSRSDSNNRGRSPSIDSRYGQRFDRSNSRGRSSRPQRQFSRERSSDRYATDKRRDLSSDKRSDRRDRSTERSVSFQRRSNSPITCRFCNIAGHKWSECFKLEKAIANGKINADSHFH